MFFAHLNISFPAQMFPSWCPTLAAPPWWLMQLDDFFARLTRAARESEEGVKEGKRKRSHSFQVTEADAASEQFRGKLCQSRQTTIVQVSPKDGGGMHLWWGGEGGTRGRVGEKFEFLQSCVTSTEVLTKRHFDGSNRVRALITLSPWRL